MTKATLQSKPHRSYKDVGVDTALEASGMEKVEKWAKETFSFCPDAPVVLDLGYFANVVDIGGGIGIAFGTDIFM